MTNVLIVSEFLTGSSLLEMQGFVRAAPLVDGLVSAGPWAAQLKKNKQIPQQATEAAGAAIVERLFQQDAISRRCYPHRAVHPTFNCYESGSYYKTHEDNPIQAGIRADLSYTLFLSEPHEYDGGELVLLEEPKAAAYKPAAGTLVIYPSGTPHRVEEVRSGRRFAAVGWIQSVVRRPDHRLILNRFYNGLEGIVDRVTIDDQNFASLNGIRIQLMRMWSEL